MAVSSIAQAAQSATQGGTQIFQPLPSTKYSGPGAGIYLEKQNQAELAYNQAMAELLQKKNTAYHQFGLNAEGAVDPMSQFGEYQSLLSRHESDLSAADEQAQQRGLGTAGLGMQGERALRYQQGGEDLSLQKDIGDVAQGYAAGSQAALLARNQSILDAQLNSLQMQGAGGAGRGLSYSGAGGAGASGRIQYSGGAREALSGMGYSDEELANQIYSTMSANGWGNYNGPGGPEPPQIMDNGQTHTDGNGTYILVKVGTATGNSTEKVYITPPSSTTTTTTNTDTTQQPPAPTTQQAQIAKLAQTVLRSRAGMA